MELLRDLIIQYLLVLCTTLVLPTSIWIICSCHIFSRLRSFTHLNYEERVRETLENTIIEQISNRLNDLFPQYGLTPPRSAPLEMIVRNLLNEAEAPDRLAYLADMYKSLVENNIQSPFFDPFVQAVLAIMGGGG